jgi:hypothetical protein
LRRDRFLVRRRHRPLGRCGGISAAMDHSMDDDDRRRDFAPSEREKVHYLVGHHSGWFYIPVTGRARTSSLSIFAAAHCHLVFGVRSFTTRCIRAALHKNHLQFQHLRWPWMILVSLGNNKRDAELRPCSLLAATCCRPPRGPPCHCPPYKARSMIMSSFAMKCSICGPHKASPTIQ